MKNMSTLYQHLRSELVPPRVKTLARRVRGLDLVPNAALARRIELIRGSVTELADVMAACREAGVVFATFALTRFYERLSFQYEASHAVNVIGIAACKACGVRALVVTSTSNVCVSPRVAGLTSVFDEGSVLVDQSTSPNHTAGQRCKLSGSLSMRTNRARVASPWLV